MIHDIWFTLVLVFMFILSMLFRIASIIIGTNNSVSQWIIRDMIDVNMLSREKKGQ